MAMTLDPQSRKVGKRSFTFFQRRKSLMKHAPQSLAHFKVYKFRRVKRFIGGQQAGYQAVAPVPVQECSDQQGGVYDGQRSSRASLTISATGLSKCTPGLEATIRDHSSSVGSLASSSSSFRQYSDRDTPFSAARSFNAR